MSSLVEGRLKRDLRDMIRLVVGDRRMKNWCCTSGM